MNTVIVDRPGTDIGIKNSGLRIGTQQIPLRLVDMLIIAHDAALDTKTVLQLNKTDIPVLIVSKNSREFSTILPLKAKNSELKLWQYESVSRHRLGYAKYFLESKIVAHHAHLKQMGVVVGLEAWKENISRAEDIAQLLGIEGSFSRLYFSHYFSQLPKVLHKGRRSKQPPLDPVNAVLSYMYSYGYWFVTARLHYFGFDPALSYLHEPFRSHNALSSDFLELYRARLNALVLEWFLDGVLTTKEFSRKNGGVYLTFDGRKKLWEPIKELSGVLTSDIDREIALLRTAIA